jgi:hypothetical protein
LIGKQFNGQQHAGLVVGYREVSLNRALIRRSGPHGAFHRTHEFTDPLDQTAGKHLFVAHVEQLELD